MTAPAMTIGPDATIAEAAKLLHRNGIKRMPVVDPAGPLLGIVSRADLLKVFLRPDADIAREIRQEVLVRAMWMDPDTVGVDVRDGVVTLTGQLERRACRATQARRRRRSPASTSASPASDVTARASPPPVWFVEADGRLLVETDASSYKVRPVEGPDRHLLDASTGAGGSPLLLRW